MSASVIRLSNKMSVPDFMPLSIRAHQSERVQLPARLPIRLALLMQENLNATGAYSAPEGWLSQRESVAVTEPLT